MQVKKKLIKPEEQPGIVLKKE